jgi:hypothetical protein
MIPTEAIPVNIAVSAYQKTAFEIRLCIMLSSLPMSHISFEKRLVLFNRVAAYSLNILADERGFAGHGFTSWIKN